MFYSFVFTFLEWFFPYTNYYIEGCDRHSDRRMDGTIEATDSMYISFNDKD